MLFWLLACGDDKGGETGLVVSPDDSAVDTAPPLDSADTALPCVDDSLADAVETDDTCTVAGETKAVSLAVEWDREELMDYPTYNNILVAPTIADVTGDGYPDIVVAGDNLDDTRHGVLHVLDGGGKDHHWTLNQSIVDGAQVYPFRYTGVAVGDVDADGDAELAIVTSVAPEGKGGTIDDPEVSPPPPPVGTPSEDWAGYCYPALVDHTGTMLWLNWDVELICGGHAPAMADLEGDGEVEVVVAGYVLEGATGQLRSSPTAGTGGFYGYEEVGTAVAVADLDGDGLQEVVAGTTLYDSTGSAICSVADAEDGFPAVADVDDDGDGDVVSVGNGWVTVYDASCTELAGFPLDGAGIGGPPALADVDDDGQVEIFVGNEEATASYTWDGTWRWSIPTRDESSHATGAALFDFEGDDQVELLYMDEEALYVVDADSGELLLSWDEHESKTLHEYPVVADVDADGEAEIIVPQGGTHYDDGRFGLAVLGSDGEPWVEGLTTWNQYAFSITNVEDGLVIPAAPEPNWPTYNSFRSGAVPGASTTGAPDAVLLVEACDELCDDGLGVLFVRVGNAGTGTLPASTPVSLTVDGVLTETQYTSTALDPGEVSETFRFEHEPTSATLVLLPNDDGFGSLTDECSDDDDTWAQAGLCESAEVATE